MSRASIRYTGRLDQAGAAVPGEGPASRARDAGDVDWFNHRRLHSHCGDVPPVEFETNYDRQIARPH